MIFTEKIEKLLGANHLKEVIEEFLKFLSEVPQSNKDARNDANQLRGQIIVLSGRFTELSSKINTNTVNDDTANHEKAALINSFVQILNQMPSNYPDLNNYLEEKNEDDEWNDAQKKNTIEAYQIYFNKYPNGKYKEDTIKLISYLEEVRQKQDNEIKRLALLEKERRENDKHTAESQKVQPVAHQSSNEKAPTVTSATPAGSKKGLFIGIGVAVVALIIFLVMKKSPSAESAATNNDNVAADSTTAEAYNIDGNSYYLIQNRANSSIMSVMNGSVQSNSFIVVTKEEDSLHDYQKFSINGINPYTILQKQSGMAGYIDEDNYFAQETISEPVTPSQLWRIMKFKDGYFQIEDNVQVGHVLGLDPASAESEKGQKIISIKNDSTLQTQWKLIPTGEKVNQ